MGRLASTVCAAEYLGQSIRAPGAALSPLWRGGEPSPMPDLGLSDAEIDALVRYLLQG